MFKDELQVVILIKHPQEQRQELVSYTDVFVHQLLIRIQEQVLIILFDCGIEQIEIHLHSLEVRAGIIVRVELNTIIFENPLERQI